MSKAQRQNLAKKCVKCAICLPHCPTYQLSLDENESPRGRIALMQGLAEGSLVPSLKLAQHLDNCLQCGSCTSVCPAGVQYDSLLDETHFAESKSMSPKVRRIGRLAHAIVKSPKRVWWTAAFLQLLKKSYLLKLFGQTKLQQKIPTIKLSGLTFAKSNVVGQKRVTLLTGCLGNTVDSKTIQDAVFVLSKLGYRVDVPKQQSCCGSIAYHHGMRKQAEALLAEQAALAGTPETQAIISLASGCSAHLYNMQKENNYPWLHKVQDIFDFLASLDLKQFSWRPVKGTFKLHIPCTAKNQLQQGERLLQLLRNVPTLKLEPINPPSRCCGAAGVYMLEHPQQSNALGKQVLKACGTGTLVSSNIGCRLHLQSLQPERCLLHPISILAESLGLPK